MSIENFTKKKSKLHQIGIACDEDMLAEWKGVQNDLQIIVKQVDPKLKVDLSEKARNKLLEVITEAKQFVKEYKKKNLILP